MSRLLCADFYHVFCKKWLWLCTLCMMLSAVFFCWMQYTAMDYVVALDRVIFLPMAFYGVAAAGLISIVIGEDFSDGVIRNKIISGKSKISIYFSQMIVSCAACIAVYTATIITSYGMGVTLFENNVSWEKLFFFFGLGIGTCMVFGSVFCTITVLTGNKTVSAVLCMGLSFVLLYLAMHLNSILVQPEYKDGVLNIHYVGGVKRAIFEWVHVANPFGQAAGLSQMECENPVHYMLAVMITVILTGLVGAIVFRKKDIK